MELEAKTRKERLLKLKQKAAQGEGLEADEKPILKFRNFQPTSETLLSISGASVPETSQQEAQLAPEETKKRSNDGASSHPTVEKVVEGISEAVILEQKKKFKEEVSLANLAPTKPNWDLKRDVEKKLQKLERRTHVKIHEIVRDRIKAQSQEGKGAITAASSGQEFLDAIDNQTKMDNSIEEDED